MKRPGFTFIEVLVVLALVGVMAVCAIAPMVHLVGIIRDAQSVSGDRTAAEDAVRLIFRDMRSVLVVKNQTYCILRRHDIFGGKGDDVLAVATGSLLETSTIPGTVAYRLVHEDTLGMKSVLPGLYRWTFNGKRPEDLDLKESFPMDGAALVIPDVDSFRVEFYIGEAWIGDYSGAMPPAARIVLERRGEVYEVTDWLPSL